MLYWIGVNSSWQLHKIYCPSIFIQCCKYEFKSFHLSQLSLWNNQIDLKSKEVCRIQDRKECLNRSRFRLTAIFFHFILVKKTTIERVRMHLLFGEVDQAKDFTAFGLSIELQLARKVALMSDAMLSVAVPLKFDSSLFVSI